MQQCHLTACSTCVFPPTRATKWGWRGCCPRACGPCRFNYYSYCLRSKKAVLCYRLIWRENFASCAARLTQGACAEHLRRTTCIQQHVQSRDRRADVAENKCADSAATAKHLAHRATTQSCSRVPTCRQHFAARRCTGYLQS